MVLKKINTKSKFEISQVGGKAFGLQKLANNNFLIPTTYIIDTDILREICGDRSGTCMMLEDLDEDLIYAVRSSVNIEDGHNQSCAGLFSSYLNVSYNSLKDTINDYCDKLKHFSLTAKIYTDESIRHVNAALIIQEMLCPEISGVCFTINPLTNNAMECMLEMCEGTSDRLTNGTITPLNIIVSKDTAQLKNGPVEMNNRPLFDRMAPQLKSLTRSCIKIEECYDRPVDIEWAVVSGNIYFLQARAITTI